MVLQVKPTVYIDPVPDSAAIDSLDPNKYTLTTLIDSAYHNRTDLNIAKTNTLINQLNYNYQKALAIPDLTLSLNYDEAGSFLYGYYGIGTPRSTFPFSIATREISNPPKHRSPTPSPSKEAPRPQSTRTYPDLSKKPTPEEQIALSSL